MSPPPPWVSPPSGCYWRSCSTSSSSGSSAESSSSPTSFRSCATSPGVSRSCTPGSSWKWAPDRKSTRLNSSHVKISYAVFCLKKKKGRRHDGVLEEAAGIGAEDREREHGPADADHCRGPLAC